MNKLIKIKEVSDKYGITAKTLRYYEEKGLIESRRTNEYAYRMYDEPSITRLEQILILRRMNISIKDIQRIFSESESKAVLDILSRKVEDIDEEVALLHELKEIVLKFIRQIKQADFSKDSDVKMLYEQAKNIEKKIMNAENGSDENTVDLNRLTSVTDKLNEAAEARIISANDTLVMRNFKKAVNHLGLAAQEIENSCVPYGSLNPNWVWHSPEYAKIKWFALKGMIHECKEAARLTAEISAALGEPHGEFKDEFAPVSPTPPDVQEFTLEDLKSYVSGFKKSIEMANMITTMEMNRHIDYILESSPVELNAEEEIEQIRSSMKSMAFLCKNIAAVMAEIGAAIDDPESKLNRSLLN